MIIINENYKKLQSSYLFATIEKKVALASEKNPHKKIIKLGIGDVTKPLSPAIISAFHTGVEDMAHDGTFHGYGPYEGHAFLREAISQNDFLDRNINIQADEIIVSDGSKSDVGNFQDIFDMNNRIAVPDPVYPVYVDTNVIAGRTGNFVNGGYEGIEYMSATVDNAFIPDVPKGDVALLYLCFPNNPTGSVATHEQLAKYVRYAQENNALILFDAAYCAFIQSDELPHSIFEVEGAKECAVEFRSFSKTAGFTGTRCAYTVIPKECRAFTSSREKVSVRDLWIRRHSTKYNGVSYPVQRAAQAVYSDEGKKQVSDTIAYYMKNASLIREAIEKKGIDVYGGVHAPYIWVKANMKSWDFFQVLLDNAGVVTTPGVGFGQCGEGFIRISAFNNRENVQEALERLDAFL